MQAFPTDAHGIVRRELARQVGISDRCLAVAVADGQLIVLGPGVFACAGERFTGPDRREAIHRATVIAAVTSDLSAVVSHQSAAVLHNLPMLKPDLRRIHVTTDRRSGGRVTAHRHVHPSPVCDNDVVLVDGLPVTGLERTAVDVAAGGTFAQALVVLDAALRRGADRARMIERLAAGRRWGVGTAREALARADGRSESVGESWSRAQIIVAGLPVPELQREFVGTGGHIYRVDFCWDERFIGEFDGLHKYGRLLRPGETAADVVVAEKLREDDLRSRGAMMSRWTWRVLEDERLAGLLAPRMSALGIVPA